YGYGVWKTSHRVVHRRLKRTVAISQANADVVVVAVDHGKIRFAVSIKVADRDRIRACACNKFYRRLETRAGQRGNEVGKNGGLARQIVAHGTAIDNPQEVSVRWKCN